jgi:CRP/FNR family transcriptional regulator, cyclic AMP receptor protein
MMVFRGQQKPNTLLRTMELFSGCTATQLSRISSLTVLVDARQGTVLAEEGKPGREFFIIADGTATVFRSGVRLAVLGPGSFFGEMALLDGGCRTATVVADTDLSLFVFSPAEFRSLQDVAPLVAHRMLTTMGRRLRLTYDLLDSESYSAPWLTELADEALHRQAQQLVIP